jgi:hypothetical protein
MNYDFTLQMKDGEPAFNTAGGRTPEFIAAAHAVNNYLDELVKVLPITQDQLDKLSGLMAENVMQAEKGAFEYGLAFGTQINEPDNQKAKRGHLS